MRVNASLDPSGDQRGWALRPHRRTSGFCPRSIESAGVFVTLYEKIWPSRAKATVRPSAASAGDVPCPRRQAPVPFVFAAHTALSPPFGSLFGTAIHPRGFGTPPRRKVTVEPSSEISRSESTTPSSSVNLVSFTGLKSGAAAVYTLRRP